MPKITDIQPQKKRDGYYNIFIDSVYECSLSDLSLSIAGLRVGQEIDKQQKDQLIEHAAIDKIYSRALYYLRFGPRTVDQMRKYLLKQQYDINYIEVVLVKLKDQHYLDDKQYAQSWVDNSLTYKARSKRKLQQELQFKGVEKITITEVLQTIDSATEQQSIRQIIEKKTKQSRYQDKQKMTQYLMGQGFAYNAIKDVVDEFSLWQ